MKKLLGLALLSLTVTVYGQDTLKKPTPLTVGQNAQLVEVKSASGLLLKPLDKYDLKPVITGNYIIEKYDLQINSSDAKKAMKVVGNSLVIDELTILGDEMDTIYYEIYESELMNTEDYLYRIFGEVPETVPNDIPSSLTVHKTDNLDCYGIAQLTNGLVLIPYNGLLLYLRRY